MVVRLDMIHVVLRTWKGSALDLSLLEAVERPVISDILDTSSGTPSVISYTQTLE